VLALAPLSVLFFGQWSLVGLLANMVAIVWVSYVVTPLALLGVLVPGVWALSAGLMWPLLQALQAMAQWSSAVLLWPVPPWPLAALALAGAWLFMRPWALGLRLLGVPLVLPLLLWQPWRPALGEFDVWAPDVGQGNAVFVRTQSSTLLYDTGPRYSEYSDAGERVLLPWLDRRREPLRDLVLSHRDTDHTGGVHAVLMRYPGVTLWSSMTVPEDLSRARELRTCAQGRSWRRDGVLFEFIHPQPGYEQIGTATNPGSCVLRISNGQRAVLLVGDIEAAQEAHMVHNQVLSQVDVLLVPHHGSKTSSSEAFLQAVRPRWSWVQAGHMNRYGHPAGAVMARYADLGLPVVRTDRCGALHWRSDVPERTDCWRQQARRYWHDSPP
jgi:competence protein ComEC